MADSKKQGGENKITSIRNKLQRASKKKELSKEASELEAKVKELEKKLEDLEKLLRINLEIVSELDLDKLLEKIMDVAIEITGAERGFLILVERGELTVKVARNFDREEIQSPRSKFSRSIVEKTIREGKAIVLEKALESEDFQSESISSLHLISVLCVPFRIQKQILGAIYLDHRFEAKRFGEWEKKLLETIAAQEAVAITNAKLFESTLKDNLTQLLSHNYFISRIQEEIKRHTLTEEGVFSLLLIDLDNFQRVNNFLGYQSGNEVLRMVGERIQKNLREIDLLGRLGGDIFEVLLPDTEKEKAKVVAERIRKAIEATPFEIKDKKIELTASIGVVTYPEDGEEVATLRERLDSALENAKKLGKNRVYLLEARDVKREKQQKKILKELGDLALTRDGIVLMSIVQRLLEVESDLDQLLQVVSSTMKETMDAEVALVFLVGSRGSLNFYPNAQGEIPAAIEEVAKKVLQRGSSILQKSTKKGEFSSLCVPLCKKNKTIGGLYVASQNAFDEKDQLWLERFAATIGSPILNSWSLWKKEKELEQTKKRLEKSMISLAEKYSKHNIVGRTPVMEEIYQLIDKIAPTNHPVFIHGESGTGKELIARAIHFSSPRKDKPFVAENCAAVPETLLEDIFFGHVKGAFTGAYSDKEGLFELANGGTLFLDEIGDMPLSLQKKLLRVLQEGEIRRVGGKEVIPVDVRIISASNKNLRELVERGEFREDLYYRLNVISIHLPPLRERKEDIPLLVEHFLKQEAEKSNAPKKKISQKALQMLMQYHWPGNIRELQNEIARAVAMSGDREVLEPSDFSERLRKGKTTSLPSFGQKTLKQILEETEKEAIRQTLEQTDWNKAKTARILDISRTTLDKKIQIYGLTKGKR